MKKFQSAPESHSRGAAAPYLLPKLQFHPKPCEKGPFLDSGPLSSPQDNSADSRRAVPRSGTSRSQVMSERWGEIKAINLRGSDVPVPSAADSFYSLTEQNPEGSESPLCFRHCSAVTALLSSRFVPVPGDQEQKASENLQLSSHATGSGARQEGSTGRTGPQALAAQSLTCPCTARAPPALTPPSFFEDSPFTWALSFSRSCSVMWENLQLDPKSHWPGRKAREPRESHEHEVLPSTCACKPKITRPTCWTQSSLHHKHASQGSPEQPRAGSRRSCWSSSRYFYLRRTHPLAETSDKVS